MSEKQLNMHNPDEAYHYAAWCNRAAINGDTEHARLLEDIGQMTRAEAIAYMEGNHNHDESLYGSTALALVERTKKI